MTLDVKKSNSSNVLLATVSIEKQDLRGFLGIVKNCMSRTASQELPKKAFRVHFGQIESFFSRRAFND
jgi:hypothetical protein